MRRARFGVGARTAARTGGLAGCLVAAVAVSPGPGAAPLSLQRVGASEATSSESYWTPERMAGATPVTPRPVGTPAPDPAMRAGWRNATVYHGVPSIGALFFRNGDGDHYCTASVIDSRKRNLLITAAHCIHGGRGRGYVSRVAFVPQYDGGRRPYGVWTAEMLVVKWGWVHHGDPDLDFGFVAVGSQRGRRLADVVGSNRLVVDRGFGRTVNVAGYPSGTDHPIYCRDTAKRQSAYQMRFDCGGFTGGTSGSPWLLSYSTRTRTGDTNGVIGGHQRGGNHSSVSYSPYFGGGVWRLRADADAAA